MEILVLVAVALLVLALVQLGYLPPPTATTLIQIRGGSVTVARGQVSASTVDHIRSILREEGVASGYIAVTSSQRVFFSHLIPESIHQRLRNVLLNRFR